MKVNKKLIRKKGWKDKSSVPNYDFIDEPSEDNHLAIPLRFNFSIEDRLVLGRISYMYRSSNDKHFGLSFTNDKVKAKYIGSHCNKWSKLCTYIIGRVISRTEYESRLRNMILTIFTEFIHLSKKGDDFEWNEYIGVLSILMRLYHLSGLDKSVILATIKSLYPNDIDINRYLSILSEFKWTLNNWYYLRYHDLHLSEVLYDLKEDLWRKNHYTIPENESIRDEDDIFIS
jgi:hypothetical protein